MAPAPIISALAGLGGVGLGWLLNQRAALRVENRRERRDLLREQRVAASNLLAELTDARLVAPSNNLSVQELHAAEAIVMRAVIRFRASVPDDVLDRASSLGEAASFVATELEEACDRRRISRLEDALDRAFANAFAAVEACQRDQPLPPNAFTVYGTIYNGSDERDALDNLEDQLRGLPEAPLASRRRSEAFRATRVREDARLERQNRPAVGEGARESET